VEGVPKQYVESFRELPTTPEKTADGLDAHGYLTFIYPGIDLWDGKEMLKFADQTREIRTADGKLYRSAGLPILYATLAKIVLNDGFWMVVLTAIWILGMHWLDFRKPALALASVIPLVVGLFMTLGVYNLIGQRLNFMNIIVLPILLGFGVSHGLYLLHRFLEGTSPMVALRSVGAAVMASTLTVVAGFGAMLFADHNGLRTVGGLATIGLIMTLIVSFTVLAAVLQILHDRRKARGELPEVQAPRPPDEKTAA
ncbi:MAG: MMPL family transporter, partial [Myxococcaceae bacterium]